MVSEETLGKSMSAEALLVSEKQETGEEQGWGPLEAFVVEPASARSSA